METGAITPIISTPRESRMLLDSIGIPMRGGGAERVSRRLLLTDQLVYTVNRIFSSQPLLNR